MDAKSNDAADHELTLARLPNATREPLWHVWPQPDQQNKGVNRTPKSGKT